MTFDARSLAREIADLKRRLRGVEGSSAMRFRSVEGGAIAMHDDEGSLMGLLGQQPDGTFAATSLNGPKPPISAAPTVTGGAETLSVAVSGAYADPGTFAPMDFAAFDVHIADAADFLPTVATYRAAIPSEKGGTVSLSMPAGTYYVRLVTRTLSGQTADASPSAAGVVTAAVSDADLAAVQETALTADKRVTASTAAPTAADAAGRPEGALWYEYTADALVGAWRLVSGEWVAAPLDPTFVPAIDIGKGTFGSLDGARLKAASVAADAVATGTLSAAVTLSGKIQTAATGARAVMDSTGFKAFDSANAQIFSAVNGSVTMVGQITTMKATGAGVVVKPGAASSGVGQSVVQLFTTIASETGPSEIYAASRGGFPSLGLFGGAIGTDKSESARPNVLLAYDGAQRSQVVLKAERITLDPGGFGLEVLGTSNFNEVHVVGSKVVFDGVLTGYPTNFVQSDYPVSFTKVNSTVTQDVQARAFVADTLVQTPQIQTPSSMGAGTRLYLLGPSGSSFVVGADAANTRFVQSLDIWNRTNSGSANVSVDAYGTLTRSVSLERYKINVDRSPKLDLDAIKRLTPTTFYDKANAERYNDLVEKCPPGFVGPLPDEGALFPQRLLGLIAEDVAATGLHELNTYDDDGNLAGVAYDRLAVALIPWLRDNEARIAALESRNDDLEARLLALEARPAPA